MRTGLLSGLASSRGPSALTALLLFTALTVVMTWPVAAGLTRDVPGDLGDPLLNMWILGWGAESVPRVVTGAMSVRDVWNANIFHPEPLALAFSEHLFGQVLQILPIYHLTGNVILCYNLLFLSTFILSGLGMYLLVRDLTGDPVAATVAGIIYAFVPYRIVQISHLQVMSAQWMPLALYGFRRFIVAAPGQGLTAATLRPLAGGTAALLMQNWSCGYYLIYFAPFVAIFVLHQVLAHGVARHWRVWLGLCGAAVAVGAGTLPFLVPYLEAQRVHGFVRPLGEVMFFSADVYGYLTASEMLHLWDGLLRFAPKPEGELFLGLTPLLLGAAGLATAAVAAWRQSARPRVPAPRWRRILAVVLTVIAVVQGAGFVTVLLTGGFVTSLGGLPLRATNAGRLLQQSLAALALLMVVSVRARRLAARALRSPLTLAAALVLLAVVLSLGPVPMTRGRSIAGVALYAVLYEHVPGFDGLRVPARLAMIVALFVSVLAGCALARFRTHWRGGVLLAGAAAVLFLAEAFIAPLVVNSNWGGPPPLPARVHPRSEAPPVYHAVAALDAAAVLVELPIGTPEREMRYVYYSTVHWRRLVNGYSGAFPDGYHLRAAQLQRLHEQPDTAWRTLLEAGVTHVVVHDDGYVDDEAAPVHAWLRTYGARELARFDAAVLYAISPSG